jgi:hypothetical protein
VDHPGVGRLYDFYLGGHASWAIDRELGKRVLAAFPLAGHVARANRLCHQRVVRHLAGLGIRQFVDVGAGPPTLGSTHQVAERVDQDARVIYVDNEPVTVAHMQLSLEQDIEPDRHAAIMADLRDPDELWAAVASTDLIDLTQPVALLLMATLHAAGTRRADISERAVARYRELLSPGSYLAISHATDESLPDEVANGLAAVKQLYDTYSRPLIWRSHQQILDLFGPFVLLDPGLTWTSQWHQKEANPAEPAVPFASSNESVLQVGVARKP